MKLATFCSKNTQLKFDKTNGQIRQIKYKNHIFNTYGSIWKLQVKYGETEKEISFYDGMDFSYEFEYDYLYLNWHNLEFTVIVILEALNNKTVWHIQVKSLEDEYKILKVIFPIISGFKSLSSGGEEDYLVLPWQNGWLIRNPINSFIKGNSDLPFWAGRGGGKYENEYPAQYSYQFSAYYSPFRIGYYFCTEDGDAYIKTTGYYYNEKDNSFYYALTNYPEAMGKVSEYCMPYKFNFQIFEGDWQTAANIYRGWAIKQKWCPSRLKEKNLPENLKKTDLWRINHTDYKLGTKTKEYYDTSVALKEKLGCNLALHWYGWNMGEHDLNYPEYIHSDLQEWSEKLTEWNDRFSLEGIIKIPYVNARLWDANTKSWKDENAEDSAIRDEAQRIPDEPWNPKTLLKPMCPSTTLWKEKVKNFSRYIKQNRFDGLYIDQVASYNATLCFNSSHSHPAGGGKWWNESYHDMISDLRGEVGDDKILTSESCCESYIDILDLFLILDTNLQKYFLFTEYAYCEAIPLFNMIYGDYALSYGCICRFSDSVEEFEFNFIRNLLWGILPTVEGVDASELHKMEASAYIGILKKGVDFYKENKDLFLYGRLSEIPSYSSSTMKIKWNGANNNYIKEYPSVIAVIWQDVQDNVFCLAYNFNEFATTISIKNTPVRLSEKEIKITELRKEV